MKFRNAVNGILLVLFISIHKRMKQNNMAECKPRIQMGKMEANGPGILAISCPRKKLRFIKDIHIRACNLKVISVLEIIISNKANLFLNF